MHLLALVYLIKCALITACMYETWSINSEVNFN